MSNGNRLFCNLSQTVEERNNFNIAHALKILLPTPQTDEEKRLKRSIVGDDETKTATRKRAKKTATTNNDDDNDDDRAVVNAIERGSVVIYIDEPVNAHALRYLLENCVRLIESDSERTRFRNYANKILDSGLDTNRVAYIQKDFNVGRFYAQTQSLQGISRKLRSTVAGSLTIDIDMTNAHPLILDQLAQRHNWKLPALRAYTSNREAFLARIPLPRDMAKNLMLKQMFGGNVRKMIYDSTPEILNKIPEDVWRFGREMKLAADLVAPKYPEIAAIAMQKQKAKGKSNWKFSTLSLVLQKHDNEAAQAAIGLMQERGWKVAALMHDGFMVYRRDGEQLTVDAALIADMEARVRQICNLNLQFAVKPFDEPFEIPSETDNMHDDDNNNNDPDADVDDK